jgi:sporulation integral membrane protein YlbJ
MNIDRKMFVFYLPAIIAVLITISLVLYPKEAFEASINGLAIWWNIVFPALLPFFILSQVLIGLGVVHFLGVLLEPIMRPLFNVPGSGSFVMAMGLASGFPLGAVLTTKLRRDNLCNKTEAERLLSFVNTADPLFMFGAVAVGMLHQPEAGLAIAAAHYLSSVSVGLIMRFYKSRETKITGRATETKKKMQINIFQQALAALIKAREKDGRPIGKLLGDTIRDSINTLLLIGGFIILFSVIMAILNLTGLTGYLVLGISRILAPLGLDAALAPALINGFMEIDLGCQVAGTIPHVAMDQKIIAVSAIIAWSGLSVHAQVASIISSTDISIVPYLFGRIIQAALAVLYCILLTGPLQLASLFKTETIPVFLHTIPDNNLPYWFERTIFMGGRFFFVMLVLLVISLSFYYTARLYKKKALR